MSTPNKKLESKMVTYSQLKSVSVRESGEAFIAIDMSLIPYGYKNGMTDMKKVLGNNIVVRATVYTKLLRAQEILQKRNPSYSLFVTYGYRSLEIQTSRFLKRLRQVSSTFFSDPISLYEEVHRSIAVPTVAGHPTGGAVDIVLTNPSTGAVLDFGSPQYDYSTKKYYVFDQTISRVAVQNRALLRNCMVDAGFAPFDGEWWHFSYGDREWAYYYKQKFAIYDQKSVSDVKRMI